MLKIKHDPTFIAKVEIPIPGGSKAEVKIEFKHKTKAELDSFLNSEEAKTRSDLDTMMEVVKGWAGIDAEFSRESMDALLDQYHGAARAIISAYLLELTQARLGNFA